MPTNVKVDDLKINKLTKAQYEAAVQGGTIGEYELSVLTDDDTYATSAQLTQGLATKQDTISDLATIRSGAAAGATAVQPSAIADMETQTHAGATYATKAELADKQDIIQYSTMPTASADNVGDIVQFVGTTTASYTNGYFYKCVSDGQDPATYSWEEVSFGGGQIIQYDAIPEPTADNVGKVIQYTGSSTTSQYGVTPSKGYFYVCVQETPSVSVVQTVPGISNVSVDYSTLRAKLSELYPNAYYISGNISFGTRSNNTWTVCPPGLACQYGVSDLSSWGVTYTGTPSATYREMLVNYVQGGYRWQLQKVEPSELPVTYSSDNMVLIRNASSSPYWSYVSSAGGVMNSSSSSNASLLIKQEFQDTKMAMPAYGIAIGNISSMNANATYSIAIGHSASISYTGNTTAPVVIGYQASTSAPGGIAIGRSATATGNNIYYSVAIGPYVQAYAQGVGILGNATSGSVAINGAVTGNNSILIASHSTTASRATLSDSNVFAVALGQYTTNVYIMLTADGTIPEARLADTTNATQGQVLTLDANLNAVWETPTGGASAPTLTWYTVSTAGNTLTIADTSSAQLVKIYKNGLLLQPTEDYSISGTTLTTVTAMVVGDKITMEVF